MLSKNLSDTRGVGVYHKLKSETFSVIGKHFQVSSSIKTVPAQNGRKTFRNREIVNYGITNQSIPRNLL